MSGVQKEGTTDIGGGQNVGYIDTGDWMDYTVSVSSAASYGVNLRVSSPNGGQLQIKASNGTVLATVAIPKTGGWQNWQTVSTNISLNAGAQTLRIYASAGGWNFNWFEFTGAGTVSAASTSRAELSSISYPLQTNALNIYPNPVSSNMQLRVNNSITGPVTVRVYSLSGALQKQFSLSKPETGSVQFSLFLGPITKGNYIIKVSMNNWTQSRQITKL
jgi:endoglucanase